MDINSRLELLGHLILIFWGMSILFFIVVAPVYLPTVKWSESRSLLSDSLWPHELDSPWNASGQNTGVGSLSLLWGSSPTQGSNPGLPHCRLILYQLSQEGSPILEWVAYPFSRDLPNPGIELGFPTLKANSLPAEISGKPRYYASTFLFSI